MAMTTINYDISTVAHRDDLAKSEIVISAGYSVVDHEKRCKEDPSYLLLCRRIMTAEMLERARRAER